MRETTSPCRTRKLPQHAHADNLQIGVALRLEGPITRSRGPQNQKERAAFTL